MIAETWLRHRRVAIIGQKSVPSSFLNNRTYQDPGRSKAILVGWMAAPETRSQNGVMLMKLLSLDITL